MCPEVVCRGGIPKLDFTTFVFDGTIRGRQKREDLANALEFRPTMNGYWADKAPDTSVIDIPLYALASYSSAIHTFVTINGWRKAKSQNRWLRVHSTQEWYDLYSESSTNDLQKFFDRYLKGIETGWEKTDPVRVSVLTFGDRDGPVSPALCSISFSSTLVHVNRDPSKMILSTSNPRRIPSTGLFTSTPKDLPPPPRQKSILHPTSQRTSTPSRPSLSENSKSQRRSSDTRRLDCGCSVMTRTRWTSTSRSEK
jgi:hypothetical protein